MTSLYKKLKKIYVCIFKDKYKNEWECQKDSFILEMSKINAEVVFPDSISYEQAVIFDRQPVKDSEERGISGEKYRNISGKKYSNICDETLIITDTDDIIAEYPEYAAVGYGPDHNWNVSYIITSFENISADYIQLVFDRKHKQPHVISNTERLIIREMEPDDLDGLYKVYDTLKKCPYIEPLYERRKEEKFTADYIKNMYGFYQYGLWLVILKENNTIIGRAGIENREIDGEQIQEMGYLIGEPWQHKGYAGEACMSIMKYAFYELGLENIYVCVNRNNTASVNLAEKLGFVYYAVSDNDMEVLIQGKNTLLF